MNGLRIDARRVVVLAQPNIANETFVARLHARNRLTGVVWEAKPASASVRVWRRRLERHGPLHTTSRFAALALDGWLSQRARAVSETVVRPPGLTSLRVPDVNAPLVRDLLTAWRPTLVIVSGTGLLGEPMLGLLAEATVLNVHVGMTPAYRGTHGGAWALLEGRPDRVCATVHLVDAGIDTGRPLAYVPAQPRSYLRDLAEGQVTAGLLWLEDVLEQEAPVVQWPETTPERGPLRYPLTLREWRRFRRAAAQAMLDGAS